MPSVELKSICSYPSCMLKRFSHFVAYLLLVLMPMQALATANMLVCNSVMQSNNMQYNTAGIQEAKTVQESVGTMPCHQHTASTHANKSESKQHTSCKSSCASLCANLCALTAMPVHTQSDFASDLTQVFDSNHQIYASIPPKNLQRPPITFI